MKIKTNKSLYTRIFLIFIIIILSLFGTISFMLGKTYQSMNIYEFYGNSNNIKITDIFINGGKRSNENYVTKMLTLDKNNDLVITNSNGKDPFLTLKVSVFDDVSLNFDKVKKNSNVIIKKNGELSSELNLNDKTNYSDSTRMLVLIKDYFNSMQLKAIFMLIIIYILFLFLTSISIKGILNFYNKIKSNNIVFIDIIKFILSVFLIYLSNYYLLLQIFGYSIVILIFILLSFVIYKLRLIIKNRLDVSFIIISVVVGITMLFTLPPFQVPDEMAHFTNSFQKSYLISKNYDVTINNDNAYTYLSKDVLDFINKYGSETLNSNYRVSAKTYLYDLYHKANYKNISNDLYWYGNTKHSSVFPYIPSIITSFILRTINAPVMLLYLIGKLINLVISITLCFYAIKNVTCFKKVFFIVCLFPIFIQQSAAFNMDCLTNGIFVYLLYKILNQIFDKKINKMTNSEICIIILLSIMLSLCKFGYFPMIFLILVIPNDKFKDKKNAIFLKTLIIILTVVISSYASGLLNIFNSITSGRTTRNAYKINIIWKEPIRFFDILKNTFLNRLDLDLFRGLFDGFGWSTIWNSSLLLFICELIIILIILTKDKTNRKIKFNYKSTLLILALIIYGIICASMLFTWTKTGYNYIDGLQPRYFIPVAIILYILVQNEIIDIKVKNKNILYSYGIIIVYIITLYTIIKGYYI